MGGKNGLQQPLLDPIWPGIPPAFFGSMEWNTSLGHFPQTAVSQCSRHTAFRSAKSRRPFTQCAKAESFWRPMAILSFNSDSAAKLDLKTVIPISLGEVLHSMITRQRGSDWRAEMETEQRQLQKYSVWDKPVRLFHWLNVLCILGLIAIGTILLNDDALGITNDGKILLKTVHVYIGYVFVANLLWRIVWGFIGNRFARWRAILPIGDQYNKQHKAFIEGLKNGEPAAFMGHNPLARWMVSFLFALLLTMAATGLVLGGTDVYMSPFGGYFKSWVAENPESIAIIKPYSKEGVNKAAFQEMRDFRKPFIKVHYYGFYILLAAILLHLAAVILTEVKEGAGLVSAMFTGKKVYDKAPVDLEA